MFTDDQIILQKTKDDLQFPMHRLSLIRKDYNFTVAENKTAVAAFKGKWPVRPIEPVSLLPVRPIEQVSLLPVRPIEQVSHSTSASYRTGVTFYQCVL